MDKVFVVLRHFYDSNNHTSETNVCFATCKKSSAEQVVAALDKQGISLEIVETGLYD